MSNHSVIEHRANYHYVKVEEDYITICSQGEQSPYCKALILAILEHWTNAKRDKGEDTAIYMTYPLWVEAMYGMFRRNIIILCLQELEVEKMIERKKFTTSTGKDSFTYTLCIDIVQEKLKQLPEKKPDNTRPNLNAFKNKRVQKQTGLEMDGKIPSAVDFQTADEFKNKRNIDTVTQIPNTQIPNTATLSTTQPTEPHCDSTIVSSQHAQISENVTQPTDNPPTEKKRSLKPRKPKIDADTQKRIDHVYEFFNKLACEATGDPNPSTYSHTQKATDAIVAWLKTNPTQEILREVYLDLWNSPKDPRSGFDWKANMTIQAVLNQYTTRSMAIKARLNQQAARHVSIDPQTTTYQPEEEEDELPSAYVPISMRRKAAK